VSARRPFSILDAVSDRELFAGWFKDRATWAAWFVFLRALFGLPLAARELALFRECTGRETPPTAPHSEAWLVCGRRAGKSFILSLCAVYLGCFFNYSQHLAPGERATVMIIAADRKQARVIFRYIRALLLTVPMLRKLVARETSEAFDLNNSVTIEVATASFRTTRGYCICAALLDEAAFFRTDDSANPDVEIIASLKPAMSTIATSMMLVASSPYSQRGCLFDAYRRHFGKDGPVLVWRAPTRTMNPTVSQSVVDAAMEADPASAAAEYMAEFRTDVESFVARDVVEAAVVPGRYELPRVEGVRYFGFTDPSGGSSDSMTLAIAHATAPGRVALDVVRERKAPFSPDSVVGEFADTLKSYGITRVHGDRYGGEWPREAFRKCGIDYGVSSKAKSDLYLGLLPLLNSRRVELLDHKRLVVQLCGLERRTARGGRDSIDHAPGGAKDDIVNAVAGAVVTAAQAATDDVVIPDYPELTTKRSGIPAHYLRQGSDSWRPYGPLPESIRTPIPSWFGRG
jgi:hypothetical protein